MISQIYYFRGKKSKKMYDVDYVAEDGEHLELIKSLDGKSVKEFNAWFNKMFDSVRLRDEEVDNGYGDWMKNSEIKDTKNVKLRDFGTEFEKRKKECKALVVERGMLYSEKALTLDNSDWTMSSANEVWAHTYIDTCQTPRKSLKLHIFTTVGHP